MCQEKNIYIQLIMVLSYKSWKTNKKIYNMLISDNIYNTEFVIPHQQKVSENLRPIISSNYHDFDI